MARVRRGFAHLRSFIVETFPFFISITGTLVILTLVFIVVSLGGQNEKLRTLIIQTKQDERTDRIVRAERLEEARVLLQEELDRHDEEQDLKHDELIVAIKALLDRPAQPAVVEVPVPTPTPGSRRPAPAPQVRTPRPPPPASTTTQAPSPPSAPAPTTALAEDTQPITPPVPVCDRGKSCDKGKGKGKK